MIFHLLEKLGFEKDIRVCVRCLDCDINIKGGGCCCCWFKGSSMYSKCSDFFFFLNRCVWVLVKKGTSIIQCEKHPNSWSDVPYLLKCPIFASNTVQDLLVWWIVWINNKKHILVRKSCPKKQRLTWHYWRAKPKVWSIFENKNWSWQVACVCVVLLLF